jgi:DNA adenine methylase
MKPTRPLLRYFGGKWQLRHWVVGNLPAHQFYAEPFAGAASVLLAKDPAPKGEIINDLNRDVVNLFRVMQDRKQAAELMRRLRWTPYAKAELEAARDPSDDPVERARRLCVRSFMGIEVAGIQANKNCGRPKGTALRMGNVSLTNFDKDGQRTFRNCAQDWSNWKDALPLIQERLAKVMIYERDAFEFMRLMDSPDCLLYIDPPYCHGTRSGTRYAVDFDDHHLLVETMLSLKAKIVLSGYPCEAYEILRDMFGWKVVTKDYRANMSPDRRTECLWISPNAQ